MVYSIEHENHIKKGEKQNESYFNYSPGAPELDIYARLSEGQLFHYNEPKEGLFIAESPKVIGRALDAGYEPVSFLMEERHIETEGREILERPCVRECLCLRHHLMC